MLSFFESQVLQLINTERVKYDLDPLKIDQQLTDAAESHSQDMAKQDFFSHYGLDGSTPFDRMVDAGYSYRAAGENIAAGFVTPESVVEAWMGSQGHRANILSNNFSEIGIGYYYLPNDFGEVNYYHYWTVNFGTPM